jgi:hypothetical protein
MSFFLSTPLADSAGEGAQRTGEAKEEGAYQPAEGRGNVPDAEAEGAEGPRSGHVGNDEGAGGQDPGSGEEQRHKRLDFETGGFGLPCTA